MWGIETWRNSSVVVATPHGASHGPDVPNQSCDSRRSVDAIATSGIPNANHIINYLELQRIVGVQVRGAVANYQGREYPGFYHDGQELMRFGTQAIDVGLCLPPASARSGCSYRGDVRDTTPDAL